jgi:hypothetical protein
MAVLVSICSFDFLRKGSGVPLGRGELLALLPALKRRAIFRCPSGASWTDAPRPLTARGGPEGPPHTGYPPHREVARQTGRYPYFH